LHKLAAIRIGDCIVYQHEGVTLRGEVHGWRLSPGREHRAIVGSSQYGREHEVSLSTVMSRHRAKGADRGLIEF